MKIAHILSTQFRLPPKKHNGRLFLASDLIEEQVRRGHDVTLFGHGGSKTSAKLQSLKHPIAATGDSNLKLLTHRMNNLMLLSLLYQRGDEFDVIHSHLDFQAVYFSSFSKTPTITTMHSPIENKTQHLLQNFSKKNFFFTPVSDGQRNIQNAEAVNFTKTVYNGIDVDKIRPSYEPGEYLAYVGRIMPKKGIEVACRVARKTGTPLKIVGRVRNADEAFFKKRVRPYIDGKLIEYIGPMPRRSVFPFLRGARALLFPIEWNEPFGLVVVEALAAGTPVLSYKRPPVTEIIDHGKSGLLARNANELARFVRRIDDIDRNDCRRRALDFSVEKMADRYEDVYQKAMKRGKK